jgi:hypothetical protein
MVTALGRSVENLYEARRGYSNAKPINDWPFIWKNLTENGKYFNLNNIFQLEFFLRLKIEKKYCHAFS